MLAKTPVFLVMIASLTATHQAFAFASQAPASSQSSEISSSAASGDSVWVTRPDGAQQCSPQSGQTLESGSAELTKAHVRVLGSQKGSDKKMHAQMCGIPSGRTNMFQILKEDLPKAIVLGFHEVKTP
jgi:hypothetical protein